MGSSVKTVTMVANESEVVSVDVFQGHRIVGWYYCHSGATNNIAIKIGNREPVEVRCTGNRPDVFESSFGIADCGFEINFEIPIEPDESIEIVSLATGRALYRGSLSLGLESVGETQGGLVPEQSTAIAMNRNKSRTTAASLPSLIIDVSDLIYYLGHQSNLTGIQRFQSCIILSIAKHYIFPIKNIVFTVYNRTEKLFFAIDSKFMISLLQDLMKPAAERTVTYDRQQAKVGFFPNTAKLDSVLKADRDIVIFLMGAGWGNPAYFAGIADLKRKYHAPFAMLVYDLIPIYAPDIGDLPTAYQFGKFLDGALRWSDLLFSLSHYTSFDLRRYADERSLPLPELAVTQAGSSFAEFSAEGNLSQAIEGIDGRFALFVATIEGRKNHKLIFDAWARLVGELDNPPTLICVGRFGWRAEDFMQSLAESNYLGGKIIVLEDVADSELNWLYQKCLFTLFPSCYEGWGLPVGEALSHGKICVASRKASVPEAGGNQALYVDVDDPSSLYGAIHRLCADESYRLELEKSVVESYRPIPWRLVAQRIIDGCLSVRATEPKRIWPQYDIAREYVFREAPRVFPGGSGASVLRSIKDARRGIIKAGALTDESFHAATDSLAGSAWYPPENWGTWSYYGDVQELRFSLPKAASSSLEWYISLRVCHPLAGRSCRIMLGHRLFCDILLPRSPGFIRLGRLPAGATGEEHHYSVRFLLDRDDGIERALRELDGRVLGIGLERMLFLETDDFQARMDLLEARLTATT